MLNRYHYIAVGSSTLRADKFANTSGSAGCFLEYFCLVNVSIFINRNLFLSYDYFTTYGAVATLGLTSCRTGCCYSFINNNSMSGRYVAFAKITKLFCADDFATY